MLQLFCLCFIIMSLFCLAMKKHREQVFVCNVPQAVVRCIKPLAWLLLLITFDMSAQLFGWSIGPALLFGALTMATLLITLLLTYYAHLFSKIVIVMFFMMSVSLVNVYFYI